jgi:YYY domain-containing protein
MSIFPTVFLWWLTIFVLGLICYPLTSLLFHRFIDKGYIFTKVIGIIFSSYLLWVCASLHILPFTRLTIGIIILALFILNQIIRGRTKSELKEKTPFGLIIFEEILFLACLTFWAYVRSAEPSIHGLEKFMDFGFVNSILHSTYFPPVDMWLTKSPDYTGGYFINYYYFGHYFTAFLTKLSGIDSVITYNLMMATLFAFTATLPFSFCMNLYFLFTKQKEQQAKSSIINHQPFTYTIRLLLVGLLAGFLVSLAGNLHTIYIFTEGYPNETPKPLWQLKFEFHPDRYWYPNATRFIPFTIHEFPSYSFVVADLHGHVSDIPIVFLILAFLLTVMVSTRPSFSSFFEALSPYLTIPLPHLILLGILLAIAYMTNAWDGLIYMILSGFVFLYLNLKGKRVFSKGTLWEASYKTFTTSVFLVFFFLLANLPFSLNFKPFASGVGVLCAPKFLIGKTIGPLLFEEGKCQKSPLYMLATLWGFFYYNVLGFFIFIVLPNIKNKFKKPTSKSKINSKYQIPNSKITSKFGNWSRTVRDEIENLTPVEIYIILLIILSTLLLIFPEFFYLKDIYPAHYRANTMFKLGYQAFMILGVVCAFTFFRLKSLSLWGGNKFKLVLYNSVWIVLFTLVAIYPYFGINSYYGGLRTIHGLDGLQWMANQYNDDYQAILWLRKNIPESEQPVIAEANGDSYTDYARVSANTGLPTIIGWPVHEWLWRGSYDEAGKRIPEVQTLYESKNLEETKNIIRKYNVEYIFVGQLEKEKYKNLNIEKFNQLGKVVFESGETKIYKLTLPVL